MKFRVTYLIDVVSENPDDYTRTIDVEANDEVLAVKAAAISMTNKESSNIQWIESLRGNLESVKQQLLECNYVFTNVEILTQ